MGAQMCVKKHGSGYNGGWLPRVFWSFNDSEYSTGWTTQRFGYNSDWAVMNNLFGCFGCSFICLVVFCMYMFLF